MNAAVTEYVSAILDVIHTWAVNSSYAPQETKEKLTAHRADGIDTAVSVVVDELVTAPQHRSGAVNSMTYIANEWCRTAGLDAPNLDMDRAPIEAWVEARLRLFLKLARINPIPREWLQG